MRHYHFDKGRRKWGVPRDDSHMIARAYIEDADEWVTVPAEHTFG